MRAKQEFFFIEQQWRNGISPVAYPELVYQFTHGPFSSKWSAEKARNSKIENRTEGRTFGTVFSRSQRKTFYVDIRENNLFKWTEGPFDETTAKRHFENAERRYCEASLRNGEGKYITHAR